MILPSQADELSAYLNQALPAGFRFSISGKPGLG